MQNSPTQITHLSQFFKRLMRIFKELSV